MERLLDQLTQKLVTAFGGHLVSVVLYGSGAAGDHHVRYSDLNILCVLDRVTTEELAAAADVFQWWRGRGNPSPLLLSERELETSTDCFAVEFHDMRARHRILHGRDVIGNLAVDDSFYRAQVEHELRAKLLRLRQKASGVLKDPHHLRRLLLDSLSTFCVLFRHALLLNGVQVGLRKREIIAEAQRTFGIDPLPFERLVDIREERVKPGEMDPVRLLDSYLAGIGMVIQAVDTLQK